MKRDFRRVGIVQRGHVAMRFIHCVREFNREYGTEIRTVALASEMDRGAMFVREADDVVWIGDPHFVDLKDRQPGGDYVHLPSITSALHTARADAAWLGWGFAPEHIAISLACDAEGLQILGPKPAAAKRLRDKRATKELARSLGIPVIAGTTASIHTLADAERAAEACGFPLVVKSSLGGAGAAIALASSASELAEALRRVREEAGRTFGDAECYLERYVPGARLVSVLILADSHGTVWDVGVRDGSVQRSFGKVLDEAPPASLDAEVERNIRTWAVAIMRSAVYEGVGTVEFLLEPARGGVAFLEVNARLETAHDVLEATTGMDLIKQEIFVARGGWLVGPPPVQRGHAFQVRLQARDPENAFRATPGVVATFRPPTGLGIRVEASVEDGDEIHAGFSSQVAKVVAYGLSRTEALARLERGLRETVVVQRDGTTNKSFLLALVRHPAIHAGPVSLEWLDRAITRGEIDSDDHADAAIAIAAIETYDADAEEERAAFLTSAAQGRPAVRPEARKTIELVRRGRVHRVDVARRGADRYGIAFGRASSIVITYQRRGAFERRLDGLGRGNVRAIVSRDGLRYALDVEGVSHRIDRRAGGMVRAPSPGIVMSVLVEPGAVVSAGDTLVVLEAMKTEISVGAPFAGRVRAVHVLGNVPVAPGAPLVYLEELTPKGSDAPEATESARESPPRPSFADAIATLRQAMLGYDIDVAEVKELLAAIGARRGANDLEVFTLERGLVGLFTDLLSLFRRRRVAGQGDPEDDAAEEHLITFLRTRRAESAPAEFQAELRLALEHYGVASLEPSPALDDALFWIYRARQRFELLLAPMTQILERWLTLEDVPSEPALRTLLDRLARIARDRQEALADLALEVEYRLFARPLFVAARREAAVVAWADLERAFADPNPSVRALYFRRLVAAPYPLFETFAGRFEYASSAMRFVMLEALAAQQYQPRAVTDLDEVTLDETSVVLGTTTDGDGTRRRLVTAFATSETLWRTAERIARHVATLANERVVVDLFVPLAIGAGLEIPNAVAWPEWVERVTVIGPAETTTLRRSASGLVEDRLLAGIHPMLAERLRISQLSEFEVERLPSARDVYLFRGVARENPKDERLFAFAEIDLAAVRDDAGVVIALPDFERVVVEALASLRSTQALRPMAQRLHWNRVELAARRETVLDVESLRAIASRLAPSTAGAGIEKIVLHADQRVLELRKLPGTSLDVALVAAESAPIARLSEYDQKVVRARQRGLIYPHELLRMLTSERGAGDLPPGTFTEYDLDVGGEQRDTLVPTTRPPGQNTANVIVGVIRNVTPKFPEGMARVVILGDPSKSLGSLAEPECRRILAALALATEMRVPVEWFALSSGAKIAMDSGTENMDFIAAVLRAIIEFTQAGGEVNVIVMGINVGGQPYWNAEATMLLHTRGILVMMRESAMVLTGKRALDYSGGVSAEDDFGIGGYERVMGVNGQGQYFANDVSHACRILLRHYDHCYVHPGERFPRRATTTDPFDRDIGAMPHGGELATVADVFSATANPGRKKPFNIRRVMAAAIDGDHEPLERWRDMRDAENAVVWDAHLGGYPVCLLGIESEPVTRRGPAAADGPSRFTGGTLFPLASKKIARAINAASGCRPVVVLANLSGFDGSPESMRGGQLEYGAEIGRAVVNFAGPIVFCVVSRFHGGAYVVFSRTLNENLEVAALEGTFASVIGGAPAAGVVFAGEVDARAKADPRVKELAQKISGGSDAERRKGKARLDDLLREVRAEKVGELAEEFDREHSVQRALRVGSLHAIVPPSSVRPWLIAALERGIARALTR